MAATSRRLLVLAIALAVAAGYFARGYIVAAAFLVLAAGSCALLAWAAFLLHLRDRPRIPPPLTRWQDGRR